MARSPTHVPLVHAWDPKAFQQSISQALDHWIGKQPLLQVTLGTPPVIPTNQQHVAICMCMAASPKGDNFRRFGFAQRNSHAVLLLSDHKLCCVLSCIDPHCVRPRKFHSVMLLTRMDQCSHRALNLPDRSIDNSILLRFRNATLFEDHIN